MVRFHSVKDGIALKLNKINQSSKATVGTFLSIRDPKNAMRSFATTYASKIDWTKSES